MIIWQLEAHVWEFYALGLGDPVAVSAEHGRNIGDLLDQIVVALPKVSETEDEDLLACYCWSP